VFKNVLNIRVTSAASKTPSQFSLLRL